MDHDEARMLTSARSDGELDPALAPQLADHLAGCAECRAFAEGLPRLSALAAALPREHAPAGLPAMVRSSLPHAVRAPRRLRRPVPALAAVAVVILAMVVAPTPGIRVPSAAAADALQGISTVELEREILEFEPGARTPTVTTREHIWFRSPGMVRVEREVTPAGGTTTRSLEITRPGERYVETNGVGRRETGLLPDAGALPEPLSPTIALVGVDRGPGPTVAGRATRRYEVDLGRERRVALVDAQSFSVLGDDESVILGKETRVPGLGLVRSKRTLSVRYNAPLADDLFRIPDIAATDRGFRPRPPALLAAPPAADPEGFRVALAGGGPDGEAALYTRGALPVLVTIDAATLPDALAETKAVRVGGRNAVLAIGLFGLPRVSLNVGGHTVAVSAPLPGDALIALAAALYPS